MRTVLVTAATFKPLEVDIIKDRPELRNADSNDLLYLRDNLESAIEAFEEYTNSILCSSTWDLYLDEFPDEIETPGPLSSATISYYSSSNVLTTLATTYYKVDTTNPLVGRITLKYSQSWPDTYAESNVVTVRFIAGYSSAAAIPQAIKDGLMLKMQELHDGPQVDSYGRPVSSAAIEACWARYRRFPI